MLRNLSIRNKLTLILMLASMISLVLASIGFVLNERQTSRQNLAYILSTEATIVGSSVTAALTFGDNAAATEILASLAVQEHIQAGHIFSGQGQEVFASYYHSADGAGKPRFLQEGQQFTGNWLDVYHPVVLDGELIGTVHLRADVRKLHGRLAKYSSVVGLVLLVSILLSWFASSRLHRVVSDPILRVASIARQVSRDKNFRIRAESESDDEIGELVAGINVMLEQIELRDKKLAEYTHTLEKRVTERTEELEHLTEQFRHKAYHDALTGLPNRALLKDRVELAIAHGNRTGKLFAFFYMDLDGFKGINDTLGHGVGDVLLQQVASRLVGALRAEDTVARVAGDEFNILVAGDEDAEDIARLARKLIRIVGKPYDCQGNEVTITVSIGIAVYPLDGETAEQLMKNSDSAMYLAKQSGKNCSRFYTREPR